jgi:hypothetical protein
MNLQKETIRMQQRQLETKLEIDGQEQKLTSLYSMRWVETSNGEAYPILYKNGKRVVKAWKISMSYNSPADEFGGNANTD